MWDSVYLWTLPTNLCCFQPGMSTVHEVITARHCGVKVLAFSLITNLCETEDDEDEAENENAENGFVENENAENGNAENGNVENGNAENGNVQNGNAENGNVQNGFVENGRVDEILEELKDVISKRGPILKQFVSILVQHLDKET